MHLAVRGVVLYTRRWLRGSNANYGLSSSTSSLLAYYRYSPLSELPSLFASELSFVPLPPFETHIIFILITRILLIIPYMQCTKYHCVIYVSNLSCVNFKMSKTCVPIHQSLSNTELSCSFKPDNATGNLTKQIYLSGKLPLYNSMDAKMLLLVVELLQNPSFQ